MKIFFYSSQFRPPTRRDTPETLTCQNTDWNFPLASFKHDVMNDWRSGDDVTERQVYKRSDRSYNEEASVQSCRSSSALVSFISNMTTFSILFGLQLVLASIVQAVPVRVINHFHSSLFFGLEIHTELFQSNVERRDVRRKSSKLAFNYDARSRNFTGKSRWTTKFSMKTGQTNQ